MNNNTIEKRFISIIELSQYLSVPVKTIRWWVWQRQIPYFKVGRLVRFDLKEVEVWLKNKRIDIIK